MKKHDLFKMLGIVILVYAVLTWFLDSSVYYGFLQVTDKSEIGLFHLLNMPVQTVGYFAYLFMFVLSVGAFYALLEATGLYKKALDAICEVCKKHKQVWLIAITVLIALIQSFAGLDFGMFFIFPFVIALVLMLGYDKMTALLVTLGATLVGMMGSTYAYNAYGIVNTILGTDYNTTIWVKLILLVGGILLLIGFMLLYIKKGKKNKEEEKNADLLIPEKGELNKKGCKKVWPLLTIFFVAFVLLIVGTFNWSEVFGITIFNEWLEKINAVDIKGFLIFNKLFGGFSAIGTWNGGPTMYLNFAVLLLVFSIILGIVYRVTFNNFLEALKDGAKKYFMPALLASLAYMILIIASSFPVFLTIVKWFTGEKFNIATTGISTFFGSLLYVDLYYYPQYVLQYFATFKDVDVNVLSVLFVSLYSVAMLIAPSSVLLLATLQKTDTKYFSWIKFIWKLFLALLILVFVTLTVYFLI